MSRQLARAADLLIMKRRLALGLALIVWSGAAVVGVHQAIAYETAAGAARGAPASWPSDSRIERGVAGTIVMFVHPDCPCTRASLGELAAAIDDAHAADAADAAHATHAAHAAHAADAAHAAQAAAPRVVLVAVGSGDVATARVPGAIAFRDPDAAEARRFGAETSGFVLYYDAGGALRFAGGVTGSRGHTGDNVGRELLARALRGGPDAAPGIALHAVFGCALPAAGAP